MRTLAVVGAMLVLGACSARGRPLGDSTRWAEGHCVETYTIDHEDSPLSELRERGWYAGDIQRRVPAAVIDAATQRPHATTGGLALDGQPIAWFSPGLDHLVMDGAAFAPLRAADPTRLDPDERAVVGRVKARAREGLGDRRVVELLMRAGVIQTYWQLGADVCLRTEAQSDGRYQVRLDAVHHYETNRRRQAGYGFVVEIDPEGEIVVVGRGSNSP